MYICILGLFFRYFLELCVVWPIEICLVKEARNISLNSLLLFLLEVELAIWAVNPIGDRTDVVHVDVSVQDVWEHESSTLNGILNKVKMQK